MRSDTLQRHMKVHTDWMNLSNEEIVQELKVRHEQKLMKIAKEAKRQQIVATASKLNVSVPAELQDRLAVEETLYQRLINNNKVYLETVRIGVSQYQQILLYLCQ